MGQPPVPLAVRARPASTSTSPVSRCTPTATGSRSTGCWSARPGWRVDRQSTGRGRASLAATIDVDDPAFPFPHRIAVTFTVARRRAARHRRSSRRPDAARCRSRSAGTRTCSCPARRAERWRLAMPACRHVLARRAGHPDRRRGPTAGGGRADRPPHLRRPVPARRRPRARRWPTRSRRSRCAPAPATPYAQVWVPAGRPFAALEPMVGARPTAWSTDRRRSSRRVSPTGPCSRSPSVPRPARSRELSNGAGTTCVSGRAARSAQYSGRYSARMMRPAASMSARCEKACGKFPRW